MGFFSKDTEVDALNQIEKINRDMREISATIHLNYNMIDGRNRRKLQLLYSSVVSKVRKYERIKNNLSDFEQGMLLGAPITVWNGEQTGVLMWESYLRDTLQQLAKDINY